MALDVRTIEQLAPDQSSLKAAAGLAKPSKWSSIAGSSDGTIIWGLCAGSGANPYKVAVDLRDNGSKCTCPSRKFPCKHGLALMWIKVQSTSPFALDEVPEWVGDWLKRRRGPPVNNGTAGKDASATGDDPQTAVEDTKAVARREAATAKRLAENDAAIGNAFEALEQWISDQLRTGLSAFIDDATARCRRISARMVDGKSPTLAARLDDLPGRLIRTSPGDRVRVAIDELSRLVLLSRAFRANPRDPMVRRSIASAETREVLLSAGDTVRASSTWEVLTERLSTRPDGLISHVTWLLNLGDGPRFAMLMDFHPASSGKRSRSFSDGEQFEAEIAFYPSPSPLRGVMVSQGAMKSGCGWPSSASETIAAEIAPSLLASPWCAEVPVLLPPGRIAVDSANRAWWKSECGRMAHPIMGTVSEMARSTLLDGAVALWCANRLEMLSGTTSLGKVSFDG